MFSNMEKWPLLRHLSNNVRRLRRDRGLSLAEVSLRMSALGVPLGLNGLSKVELGNRDLALDELVALGAALDVAPVLLIFPLGQEQQVQLLPGSDASTWPALKWFTGQDRFPIRMPQATWLDIDRALPEEATTLFREQDELLSRWSHIRIRVARSRNQVGARGGRLKLTDEERDQADGLEEMLQTAEEQLRRHRSHMRRVNLDPGELQPELAHLDEHQD